MAVARDDKLQERRNTPRLVRVAQFLAGSVFVAGVIGVIFATALYSDRLYLKPHRYWASLIRVSSIPMAILAVLNITCAALFLWRPRAGRKAILAVMPVDVLTCALVLICYGYFSYWQKRLPRLEPFWITFALLNLALFGLLCHPTVAAWCRSKIKVKTQRGHGFPVLIQDEKADRRAP